MASINTEKIILGSLMQDPLLLSEVDKYSLTIDDFDSKLMQHIFFAIASIASDGSTSVKAQDVHLFLKNTPTGKALFESQGGVDLLNDAINLSNVASFGAYYSLLKKENLLRDLKKMGFDTTEFYELNPITQEAVQINDKYNELQAQDIIEAVKVKLLDIESGYVRNDTSETIDAYEGIEELLADLEIKPEVGYPLQGEIFNTVVAGARRGTFYVRSGSSGVGKTRQTVGDACHLAFPIRYSQSRCKWEQVGYSEKTLIVITEQSFREVQLMMLAYLTGLNEKKIKRKSTMTSEEKEILSQAVVVLEAFRENLYIVRMPSPTIQLVKNIIRKHVLRYNIQYVFYDYIFISPSLLHEFKGFQLRNDEVLLMFSTALKDLSVELNIFVMSATQTNAAADSSKDIRNESSIAGARAIVNKADVGCIMARPLNEELKVLEPLIENLGITPNVVTDIYKNRGDEWTQVRIWTFVDLGTMRKRDLFITNSRLEPYEDFRVDSINFEVPLEEMSDLLVRLNRKETT